MDSILTLVNDYNKHAIVNELEKLKQEIIDEWESHVETTGEDKYTDGLYVAQIYIDKHIDALKG